MNNRPTWLWLAVYISLIFTMFGFVMLLTQVTKGTTEVILFTVYASTFLGYLYWLRKNGFLGDDTDGDKNILHEK